MTGRSDWRRLTGKRVSVTALGVEFRGVVVEMGERGILLRTPSGYREIPWDRISSVRELPFPPPERRSPPGGLGRA